MGEALPFRELSALADVGVPADRILKGEERDPFFVSLLESGAYVLRDSPSSFAAR